MAFTSLLRPPDLVRAYAPDGRVVDVDVSVNLGDGVARVEYQGEGASVLLLRWRGDFRRPHRYLGDHWERSYGDLAWRGEEPSRAMPWTFLAHDGDATHGYGVRTGAGAMCFWSADAEGVNLWADIRSGGVPVELGDRRLFVADVVCREGRADESAFAAARAFCRELCPNPRTMDHPVYGTNDWNYAYGKNSAELIAGVSALISELSENQENRPYSVIDEGWAMGPYEGKFGHGPWVGNPNFGDMAAFADRLRGLGVRPGIWFRPLTPLPDTPDSWRLSRNADYLDPTLPEVHDHVARHIRRLVDWDYEMVKHDFTTWDFLGRWGMEMGSSPTRDGWRPADATRTNAEIISDLYATIREAAGDARLIGCNTVGHLAAGTHELQRTGDDTSGRTWNRNRRMGVNTLAFRAAQHRSFFQVDPDIVAITRACPWPLVENWLRLVAESGTALFVAVEPDFVEPKHREALRNALSIAAREQPVGEPLDWMERDCPRRWRLRGRETDFDWMGEAGAWPYPD